MLSKLSRAIRFTYAATQARAKLRDTSRQARRARENKRLSCFVPMSLLLTLLRGFGKKTRDINYSSLNLNGSFVFFLSIGATLGLLHLFMTCRRLSILVQYDRHVDGKTKICDLCNIMYGTPDL